jgi:integrating conjugative element protein (TIGR03759 family)
VKYEVMLFVDVNCTKACERLFAEVQKTTDDRSRLDVYFAPGTTADQIGAWAAEMKLDPEVVRNREVTLNFDRGMSAQLGVSMNELPEVHVRNTTTGVVRETFTRW